MLSSIDLVGVKQLNLLLLKSDEGKFDGVGNIIQRDTTSYFKNIFQF
jgi:hypothetical protein